jgi:hypothetical protein
VDFTLDPLALEMRGFEVQLTDVKVADQKYEAHVHDNLTKALILLI